MTRLSDRNRSYDHKQKNHTVIPRFFNEHFNNPEIPVMELYAINAIFGEVMGMTENDQPNVIQAKWLKFCAECDDPNGFIQDFCRIRYE